MGAKRAVWQKTDVLDDDGCRHVSCETEVFVRGTPKMVWIKQFWDDGGSQQILLSLDELRRIVGRLEQER